MSNFEKYCHLCNQGPISSASQWTQHINGKKHKKNEWTKGSCMQSDEPDDKRSTKFVASKHVTEIEVPIIFDDELDDVTEAPCHTAAASNNHDDFPSLNAGSSAFSHRAAQPLSSASTTLTSEMSSLSIGRGRGRAKPSFQSYEQEKCQSEQRISWSSIAKTTVPELKTNPQQVNPLPSETEVRRQLTQSERSGNVQLIPRAAPVETSTVNRPMAKNPKYASAKRIYHEFKSNKKTASQAFQEIATTLQWTIEAIEVPPSDGSLCSYALRWKVNAFECEPGEGSKKKQAKENASRKALLQFARSIENPSRASEYSDYDEGHVENLEQSGIRTPHNPADEYKRLTNEKLNELVKRCGLSQPVRFAAFIITTRPEQPASEGIVIAFGSGRHVTKMTFGDAKEAYGYRLHDMQAPILARRAFQAYLYGQLSQIRGSGSTTRLPKYGENILEFNAVNGDRYKLKEGVRIHLYLSHAPSGDAVSYIRHNWQEPDVLDNEELNRDLNGILKPVREDFGKGYGKLRAITDPIRDETAILDKKGNPPQGRNDNERVRIMSLSDKLLKWNHVGVQGSLLTHFIEPIFLYSLQMGCGYSHGHMARALLTRVPTSIFPSMPGKYSNPPDPFIGRTTKLVHLRKQIEGAVALNWFLGASDIEVINCDEGTKDPQYKGTPDGAECSRLSRVTMLQRFECRWESCVSDGDVVTTGLTRRLRQNLGVQFKENTYGKLKSVAEEYQKAKHQLYGVLFEKQLGLWQPKEDLQLFSLIDYEEDA